MIEDYISRTIQNGQARASVNIIPGCPDNNNHPVEEEKPTAPTTPQEMLDAVNDAIMAIMVGGQMYKIGSRMLTRADLKQLYQIKNDLTAQIAAGNNTGLFDDCYVAVFDHR